MPTPDRRLVSGIMESLTAQRRRFVLGYLLNAEAGQFTFDELVDCVVEEETHSLAPDRVAVAASLYHQHLPKLADEGLVGYDGERGSITTTAETELVEPFLEFAGRGESEIEA